VSPLRKAEKEESFMLAFIKTANARFRSLATPQV